MSNPGFSHFEEEDVGNDSVLDVTWIPKTSGIMLTHPNDMGLDLGNADLAALLATIGLADEKGGEIEEFDGGVQVAESNEGR